MQLMFDEIGVNQLSFLVAYVTLLSQLLEPLVEQGNHGRVLNTCIENIEREYFE